MERYCHGELEAFHEIYDTVAPRLLGYLASMVGDKTSAEDLLQQTFLKVHQSRPFYLRGANPIPWLYAIAHRTCLDELRRRKRSKVVVSRTGDMPDGSPVGITGSVEDDAMPAYNDEKLLERGMQALALLPESQREAVVATKIQGRSLAAAASQTGISEGALKQRTHRGYLALRQALGESRVSE
jgi:RNA polymerase sigma-70 factor (ECF subfamily)